MSRYSGGVTASAAASPAPGCVSRALVPPTVIYISTLTYPNNEITALRLHPVSAPLRSPAGGAVPESQVDG